MEGWRKEKGTRLTLVSFRSFFRTLAVNSVSDFLFVCFDKYVSWLPDPGAWIVDAFEMFTSYCFPIFSLIPKVLQMTETLGGDSVPVRVTQPWITELLRLPVDLPVLLAQGKEILKHPMTGDVH